MRDSLQLLVREGAEEAARLVLLRSFSRFYGVLSCAPDYQRLPISSSCKHRSLCVTNLRSTVHRHFHFQIMSINHSHNHQSAIFSTSPPGVPCHCQNHHSAIFSTSPPGVPLSKPPVCHHQYVITSMPSLPPLC